jgi:hypothetical protein
MKFLNSFAMIDKSVSLIKYKIVFYKLPKRYFSLLTAKEVAFASRKTLRLGRAQMVQKTK